MLKRRHKGFDEKIQEMELNARRDEERRLAKENARSNK
jgi:hypothetical protein